MMDKHEITQSPVGRAFIDVALTKGYISEDDLSELNEIIKIIRTLYPNCTEPRRVYLAIDMGGNIAKLKENADKASSLQELDRLTLAAMMLDETDPKNQEYLNDLERQKKAAIFGQDALKVYNALIFARDMEKISS